MQAGKSIGSLTKALEALTRVLPPRPKPGATGSEEQGTGSQPSGQTTAASAQDRPDEQAQADAGEPGPQPRSADQVPDGPSLPNPCSVSQIMCNLASGTLWEGWYFRVVRRGRGRVFRNGSVAIVFSKCLCPLQSILL